MEHVYAEALMKAIERGTAPKKALESLHAHLVAKGRSQLMPRIAKAVRRLAARYKQKNVATLYIAKDSDERKAMREAREHLGDSDVQVAIDESLIGGWRLEGKETLVDASYKKSLLDMYNAATR